MVGPELDAPDAASDSGLRPLSPAERYAASRTALSRFCRTLDFELDPFQRAACEAIERGSGVLVAAPTGAGKTVVAEFAITLALARGAKAFYTTPIKALSNQKYHDLVARFGSENVGLLTGDTAINSHAPVVVMTTEVLRNMLYAESDLLAGLDFVIMDEVHYLADRFRGPVWEEVIIHLDPKVQLVSLSATVSNAEEVGDWLELVRGDTEVIVSEHRPVPLWQQVLVGSGSGHSRPRLLDLEVTDASGHDHLNPDLVSHFRQGKHHRADGGGRRGGRGDRRGSGGGRRDRFGGGQRDRAGNNFGDGARTSGGQHFGGAPTRAAVVVALDEAALLPAIYFIFSRAGCEAAVQQLLTAGVRLTSAAEEAAIQAVIDRRTADLPSSDLDVLGFWTWQRALRRGIAAHHAGLLPVFKETVEELFEAGLVKVVFATETLALGINMPARTVVLEKLIKWDGAAHQPITAGEYTQLTGRAGRRGIDVEGYAVVVDHARLDPEALAGLASRRTYPLTSSFRPTYNMAVNLISSVGQRRAREVLELSFAQFQADRGVVGLARQVRAHQEALAGYEQAMRCEAGDVGEYLALRDQISALEKQAARARRTERREATVAALTALRPGDVVRLTGGRRHPNAVVLTGGSDRVSVLTGDKQVKLLNAADVAKGLEVVSRVRIPRGFNARRPADRRDLTSTMFNALRDPTKRPRAEVVQVSAQPAVPDAAVAALRAQLKAHPVHSCPDRGEHLRWAERWRGLEAERAKLLAKIEGRTGTVARTFDKTCQVLEKLGYLEPAESSSEEPTLIVTPNGEWLRRLYAENDLLLAECLRRGAWDGLTPSGLAAVLSAVVYEGRGERQLDPALPGGPAGAVATALDATTRIWSELTDLESEAGLTRREPSASDRSAAPVGPTGELDFGLVAPIYRWAQGKSLSNSLRGTELAPGDFVRWCKQVIDVLDQLSDAAPTLKLRKTATAAKDSILRGIVAYSGV